MNIGQITPQHLLTPLVGLTLTLWLVVGCSLPASSPPADSVTATPPSTIPTFTPAPPTFTPLSPPTRLAVSTLLPPAPSPPGHPTALPLPPTPDGQAQLAQVKVDISAHPATLTVGDLITVTGRVTNLGLPQYTLYLRGEPAVVIRYDGELISQGFTGATVEFISASASQTQAEFTLRAAQPGTVSAIMNVSGEIRPDPEQRAEFLNFEVLPGTRIISGQADRQVPAGLFQACFEITTFYNGGSPISWFCPGVGVIETHFDHVGTPFGHTIVLLDYRLW